VPTHRRPRSRPRLARLLAFALLGLAPVGSTRPALATFPGANGRIVFQHGGPSDLFTMEPDGTGVLALTESTRRQEREPAWSPDGATVAFSKDQPRGNWNVFTKAADGSGLTQITRRGGTELHPTWSPNGRRIVFEWGISSEDLYAKRLADGKTTRITVGMEARMADWSVPGVVAFMGVSPSDTEPEIYTIHPDGTGLVQLTDDDVFEEDPDVSPDGTEVAYAGYDAANASWEIFVVPIGGGSPTNLTARPDAIDTEPSWSPDGTTIVFHSVRDGHDHLYVMNADGSTQTLIDDGLDGEAEPDRQAVTP